MNSSKRGNQISCHAGVVAARYLCLPALIENILVGFSYTGLDQFRVANSLGVVVPGENGASHIANYSKSPDPHLWGVRPDSEALNILFKEHEIPVCCEYHRYSLYEDWMFESFVVNAHENREPIIFCFDYSLFSGRKGGGFGHSAQLLTLQDERGAIKMSVYDPGPEGYGVKIINSQDMYYAMRRINGGWLHFTTYDRE